MPRCYVYRVESASGGRWQFWPQAWANGSHDSNSAPLCACVHHELFGQRPLVCPACIGQLELIVNGVLDARVAELVDAPDLGSGAFGREGSTPFARTIYT